MGRWQAAAALAAAAAAAWGLPLRPAAAAAEAADVYSSFPYVTPSDILPFLRAEARPGDVDSVLAAIDAFATFYPMYRSV